MKKTLQLITTLLSLCVFCVVNTHAQYVLRKAEEQADLYNYVSAKSLFTKAYEKKQTIDAARGLAQIYAQTNDYLFAESWYAKVVAMPAHLPEDEFHYAQALMNNSKYGEAATQLEKYLGKKGDDKVAQNMLEGCKNAREWMTHPVKGNLENMKVLNSAYSDWGLTILQGQYIFSSDRTHGEAVKERIASNSAGIKKSIYTMTGNSYLHLYESDGKDSGSVKLLDKTLNGDYHSATPSYTADAKQMYYAATNLVKKPRTFLGKERPYTLNVAIVSSTWDSTSQKWGEPQNFPYNEIFNYSIGDPFVTPDGSTLYFASSAGSGSRGGTDLYYCKKDVTGQWQAPINMGLDINTEGDERTPFMAEDGTLYFASNGRAGMGGLDIFKAVPNGKDKWIVTNMGSPINSPQDDFAPFFATAEQLYFSSNRMDGRGSDDIYRFDIAKVLKFSTSGVVRDRKTNEPLKDVVVSLTNLNTGTTEKVLTDAEGKYQFNLDTATDYKLRAEKTDYAATTTDFSTKGIKESKDLYKDIFLDKIVIGVPVRLSNIYFDFDKWNIRPDAAKDLDGLVKLLNDNPTWKIEMSSHTDSRGSDKYNMKLSQKRAESTVQYLIEHGIAADRLTAKGYGETRLLNKCSNGVKCTEEEHALNRRTEFTLLDK